MKQLTLSISNEDKPIYLRLADALRLAIQKEQVQQGEALPSTRELAHSFGIHRHTVMAALEELNSEGWIIAEERKGYRVCETLPIQFFRATKEGSKSSPIAKHNWRLTQTVALPPLASLEKNIRCDFTGSLPDLRKFPFNEFKSHLSDALKKSGAHLMSYGSPLGHPPLINELKIYLRRVRGLNAENLVVTHGSQEAIFMTGQLLLRPGDKVAVEELGYQPAFGAFRSVGAELVPIRMDTEGIDPDAFEKAAKRHKIRLLYVTPLHQYPTMVTLSISRRLRLYEIAVKYGIPVLEDDYDHEFHYRSQPLAPLAANDPAGLVIYVSTFSKVVSPSARIGFMSVPTPLLNAVTNQKRMLTRQNDFLLQDAVSRWMRDGGFERHLRRMRRIYEERRNALVEQLQRAQDKGLGISWKIPDGGMAIWVNTHRDSTAIAQKALQLGIYVACEGDFKLSQSPGTHLRIGFAHQSPAEAQRGLQQLFEIIG